MRKENIYCYPKKDVANVVSMSDIAELLGVSCATVSRALNNSPKISAETKQRVLQAAEKLGYLDKLAAKRQQVVKKIGFIISKEYFGTHELFYTRVLLGSEKRANKDNMRVNLFTFDEQESVEWLFGELKEFKIDGVIVAAVVSAKLLKRLLATGVKIVLVDFEHESLPVVEPDNFHGAYQAVQHLYMRGRQQIAFVSGEQDHPCMRQRYYGYRAAVEEGPGDFRPELAVLSTGCCSVEDMATGLMRAFQEKSIRIPEDVSVVGFDDLEMGVYTTPSLSTVRIHKERMGEIAAAMLVNWPLGWETPGWRVIVPTELVIRQSS
jgi:DNA-binding LacI/PurR family transcriptional regulator